MPTAANPASSIVPRGGPGGTHAQDLATYTATAELFTKGDCVVAVTATGRVTIDNVDPVVNDIVGFVADTQAVAATAGDELFIYEALPGVRFEGNLVATTSTDLASGVFATHILTEFGFVEGASSGFCALDVSEVTTIGGRTLSWARQFNVTQVHTPFAATLAVANPRVEFVVPNSMFARFT